MTTSATPPDVSEFGHVTQIAWVTDDLDATEGMLSAVFGVKKWTRIPDVHFGPNTCTYRGAPADFTATIALSYLGDMQLELILPVSGTSIYTEFLETSPAGLHHVCFEPPDLDAALDHARARGAEVIQDGVMPGGMRFAYLSAPAAALPYMELAFVPPEIRAFYNYIKSEQA
ncbi:lactoylglutathione lyase [Mycobacteroides saopaulense]|uniref:Lactoylglutathione lyase n=1 Tax=Mycobacteroides saopaulense TaxID=1578165 RepID=A0A1S4VR66_9MYCO|nr:VOC family protein [Mycobacteroides saopaulense]ALR11894.1 lactoylglutathione lyase [Mycobacteroides saopaulense]ORB60933.1 lactoylglutathione lyase [Mycobacteroides saopaulense]